MRKYLGFLLPGILFISQVSFSGCSVEKVEKLAPPLKREYVDRGRSLVKGLASCGFCHGEVADPSSPLIGGRSMVDIYGEVMVPNITPARSGLGEWTTDDLVAFFRTSNRPDGEPAAQGVHRGYEWLAEEDLLSIIGYLKTLAPIENKTERRELSFVDRNTSGLLESKREIAGYVPAIHPKFRVEYGQYLVDNVARCGSCHNTRSGFLSEPGYLTGGVTVRTSDGESTAPDISNSDMYGIGKWSEASIVSYLQTGKTPTGESSDSRYCPTGFYRNADPVDLAAIAAFLKTVDPQ